MTAAGATGAMRAIPGGPTTGSIRTIPGSGPMTGTITRPQVQPAGGARDFGWPHIAVLAAVAFTLGIVVWKVSGLGG
jgi:Na+-transporting NADH:ubiquinone oxidoreductase subunit NqrD